MAGKRDVDQFSGVETTGHEWDGIKELNNPLPRWWLWTLYATILWSFGYWVVMPAWPLISDYTRGVIGYSQRAVLADTMAKVAQDRAARAGTLVDASLEDIEKDPEMQGFAFAAGQAAFGDNCAPCHGGGAQGAAGYPNLSDDDWLWGGGLEDIHTTILYGIRGEHSDTRYSQMPAFLKDEILTAQQVDEVVEYVLSISGQDHDRAKAASGAQIFAENCTVCHAEDGKGDRAQGAPNLTDAVWLYGGEREAIRHTVAQSRFGIMPAWTARLDPVTIKSLAVYVHSLGGGE